MLDIQKRGATSFIACAIQSGNKQLLVNIPKDVVRYLGIEAKDKVEITIRKTGMKSTRKRGNNTYNFSKKEKTQETTKEDTDGSI